MSVFIRKTGRYNRRIESSPSVFNEKTTTFLFAAHIFNTHHNSGMEYLLLSRFFHQISGVRTAFCVGIEFDADLTLMKFTVFSPFVTRRRINKITRIQMARRGSFVFCSFIFYSYTFSSRAWLKVYTERWLIVFHGWTGWTGMVLNVGAGFR